MIVYSQSLYMLKYGAQQDTRTEDILFYIFLYSFFSRLFAYLSRRKTVEVVISVLSKQTSRILTFLFRRIYSVY